MSGIAVLSEDLAAIAVYPAAVRDIHAIYPGLQRGTVTTDQSLSDWPRLVLVREVPRPAGGYGDTISEGPPTKLADGHWHQTWVVVPPNVAALKQQAKSLANRVAEGKISILELARGLARGTPGPLPRTSEVLAKLDEVRTRIDAAVTAADVKVIIDELEAF